MPHPRLYDDLADLWPLLSPPSDYAAEAHDVRRILTDHLAEHPPAQGDRPALLELGAGGGHTIHHLTDDFHCTALDIAEPMLANCRALNPAVDTIVGDMRTVRLERTFDAVLVHDAVDYMTSEHDARAAIDTAAAHLRPGGVALIAPTYTRENFENQQTETDQRTADGRTLTYLCYVHDPDPHDSTFELVLVYLIRDAQGELRIEHDRHTCGLFDAQTWLRLMDAAGFDVTEDQAEASPWTLFVGVKR